MMNFLALGLVLTSLVTAGFFTPTPQNPKSRDEGGVIVREGRRVVVVEYEKDDGNTKVLISPHDEAGFHANAKDKLNEKMEKVKDGVKEASSSVLEEMGKLSPRELVCDAYGKCKHKIASAFEKTKESAAEAASSAEGAAKEAAGRVRDTIQESKEKVKDSANEVKDEVAEKAGAARKELGEILRHAWEVAGDVFDYVAPRERERVGAAAAAGVVHLMGFAAAYGMGVWITFASSYVLAGALPRQQFAAVQSKIYPVYFKGMGYGVGLALLGHLVGRRDPAPMLQGMNLAAALGMIAVNLRWLEPQATKVMVERMKKRRKKAPGRRWRRAGRPETPRLRRLAEVRLVKKQQQGLRSSN